MCTPSPGGYKIRTNIPALPFYHYRKTAAKPSYPVQLDTLGDHIRKVRLDRVLSQKQVAELIGVDEDTITTWENGRRRPQIQWYPKILAFLRYNPFAHDLETISGKLRHIRVCNGYSVKVFARILNIDPATLKRWEKGIHHIPKNIEGYWKALPPFLKQSHSL
jgi:DNA-binding transcriptional regulator YiaG